MRFRGNADPAVYRALAINRGVRAKPFECRAIYRPQRGSIAIIMKDIKRDETREYYNGTIIPEVCSIFEILAAKLYMFKL